MGLFRAHNNANKKPILCVPLHSIFVDGGITSCIDVIITKVNEMKYMETLEDGTKISRSKTSEELEKEKFQVFKNTYDLLIKIERTRGRVTKKY